MAVTKLSLQNVKDNGKKGDWEKKRERGDHAVFHMSYALIPWLIDPT